MKQVRYLRVDAFSSGLSLGNPAGVVHLNGIDDLAPEEMQRIARDEKGKVSEVVFCAPRGPGAFELRYYSSECEVEFCGHGSIACMYELFNRDPDLAAQDCVVIETRRGSLPVFNDLRGSDAVYIASPSPQHLSCGASREQTADALGLPSGCLGDSDDLVLINAGLRTLIVPMIGLNDVLEVQPDIFVLGDFCLRHGVDIVLVYSSETADPANGYRTRVFAPKFGYLEDPATGSGNSALGYHLLERGQWDGSLLQIEQGPSRDEPNIVRLKAVVKDGERRVLFGGSAVTRCEKTLSIGGQ